MKRFLSWIVLCLLFTIFYNIGKLIFSLSFGLLSRISEHSLLFTVVVLVLFGGVIIGLLLTSLRFGPALTFAASEHVKPSRRGLRYRVFSIFNIILASLLLFSDIYSGEWKYVAENVYIIIFSIVLLFCVKGFSGASDNARQKHTQNPPCGNAHDRDERLKRLSEMKVPYIK